MAASIKQIQEQVWQDVCKYGIARWLVNKIVTTVFNQIPEQLLAYGSIRINGVGVLKIVEKKDGTSSIVFNSEHHLEYKVNKRIV